MTKFQKEKKEKPTKNKLRLSLRGKKVFLAKNWGKFDNKVQKLPNFKEKKGLFKAKKQAGAELRNKKRILRVKNLEKL